MRRAVERKQLPPFPVQPCKPKEAVSELLHYTAVATDSVLARPTPCYTVGALGPGSSTSHSSLGESSKGQRHWHEAKHSAASSQTHVPECHFRVALLAPPDERSELLVPQRQAAHSCVVLHRLQAGTKLQQRHRQPLQLLLQLAPAQSVKSHWSPAACWWHMMCLLCAVSALQYAWQQGVTTCKPWWKLEADCTCQAGHLWRRPRGRQTQTAERSLTPPASHCHPPPPAVARGAAGTAVGKGSSVAGTARKG